VSASKHDHDREEGLDFQPKFDASGLVTCVATDAATGDVLMVAHMNEEALRKTIASGEAWYFSRSRNALWRKGETSGQTQRVVEMRLDCDQDAVWIAKVDTDAFSLCAGPHHRPDLNGNTVFTQMPDRFLNRACPFETQITPAGRNGYTRVRLPGLARSMYVQLLFAKPISPSA